MQRDASDHQSLSFSDREQAILRLLCEGKSNKEIAGDLGIGENNVKRRLSNLSRFLGLSGRTQLMAWCYSHTSVLRVGRANLAQRESGADQQDQVA